MTSPAFATGAHGRNFGLDLLRAVAILLVLVGHSLAHQAPPEWARWFFGGQGMLGVELFFVLSGFLIGGIIIRLARSGRLHTPGDVWQFWARRWARTLPAYFLFLLVYARVDYLGPANPQTDWPFMIFMQNFAWPQLPFFQHSWSLAIEEWFYFLFPLVFLVFAAGSERSYRWPMLLTCVGFIVVPMYLRWQISAGVKGFDDFNFLIRMVVVCRLDSIFFGVLLALVRAQYPGAYSTLGKLWWVSVPAFAAMMVYIAKSMPGLVDSRVAMTVFFPVLSLVCASLIPAAERLRTLGVGAADRFVTHTSLISYSLYLGHICMLQLVNAVLGIAGVQVVGTLSSIAVYGAYFVAYYALATLTYNFVEKPYLELRDMRAVKAA